MNESSGSKTIDTGSDELQKTGNQQGSVGDAETLEPLSPSDRARLLSAADLLVEWLLETNTVGGVYGPVRSRSEPTDERHKESKEPYG